MEELLEQWRDPVFNDPHRNVPAALAARLTEIADELTAGENIAESRIPDAPDDLLVTPLRHGAPPRSLRVYYERMHALLAVASIVRSTEPATLTSGDAPSDAEKRERWPRSGQNHQASPAQLPGRAGCGWYGHGGRD